jgi:hypothetical protein
MDSRDNTSESLAFWGTDGKNSIKANEEAEPRYKRRIESVTFLGLARAAGLRTVQTEHQVSPFGPSPCRHLAFVDEDMNKTAGSPSKGMETEVLPDVKTLFRGFQDRVFLAVDVPSREFFISILS